MNDPGHLLRALALLFLLLPTGVTPLYAKPPVAPQALLAALPEAPVGWEVVTSKGQASVGEASGFSQAQRRYRATARQANDQAEGAPPRPTEIAIEVSDTLHNALPRIAFARGEEGATGGLQKTQLAGHPAILTGGAGGEDPLTISLLAGGRFLFRIQFKPDAPEDFVEAWIADIDVPALARYRYPETVTLSSSSEISLTVDELAGGRAKAYRSSPEGNQKAHALIEEAIKRGLLPGDPSR